MAAPGILTTPFGGWFARTRPTVLIIDCTRPLSTSGSVLRPLRAVASPAATPRSGCCGCATPIARAPRQPRSGQVPGVGESGASPLLRHPGRNAVPPEVLSEKREAMASALRNLTKVAIPVSSNIATGRAGERAAPTGAMSLWFRRPSLRRVRTRKPDAEVVAWPAGPRQGSGALPTGDPAVRGGTAARRQPRRPFRHGAGLDGGDAAARPPMSVSNDAREDRGAAPPATCPGPLRPQRRVSRGRACYI